jgi:mono/diheme cytochrome c family protein
MKSLLTLMLGVVVTVAAALAVALSGAINFAADEEHAPAVYRLIETARERSIQQRAADLAVSDLDDPARLLAGAPDYHEMCTACHLRPGLAKTDLTLGLYPRPPALTLAEWGYGLKFVGNDSDQAAARQFWIIKHGVKGSGMAAYGQTHSDEQIWNLVAFIRRLPDLTESEYRVLSRREATQGDVHAHP